MECLSWRRPSDEMPAEGQTVLAYNPTWDNMPYFPTGVMTAVFMDGQWRQKAYGMPIRHPSAWMPLPTPPSADYFDEADENARAGAKYIVGVDTADGKDLSAFTLMRRNEEGDMDVVDSRVFPVLKKMPTQEEFEREFYNKPNPWPTECDGCCDREQFDPHNEFCQACSHVPSPRPDYEPTDNGEGRKC